MTKLTMRIALLALFIVLLGSCAPLPALVPPSAQQADRVCRYAPGLDTSSNFSELESSLIVNGTTLDALRRSLASIKPEGAPNEFASTRWSVRWDFNWRPGSTGCKVTSAVAMAEIDYRFPVWPQQLNISDRSLVSRWGKFSDEFRARHCRYGEFSIQAAQEVEQALKTISPRTSCQRLQADANELAGDIVGRYQKLDQQLRAQATISPL